MHDFLKKLSTDDAVTDGQQQQGRLSTGEVESFATSPFFLVLREIPGLLTEQTGSDHDFENGRIARKLPDTARLILG